PTYHDGGGVPGTDRRGRRKDAALPASNYQQPHLDRFDLYHVIEPESIGAPPFPANDAIRLQWLHLRRDAGVGVQIGHHTRIVLAYQNDPTKDAAFVDNGHVRCDAVSRTGIQREVVLLLRDVLVDDADGFQPYVGGVAKADHPPQALVLDDGLPREGHAAREEDVLLPYDLVLVQRPEGASDHGDTAL